MKLYQYAKDKFRQSDFLKVFSGNLIGSGVYALSIPLLSRLFDKVAFGNFQLLFSTVSVFTPVASLKYEKTIMLAQDKYAQAKSYLLSLVILLLSSAFLYLLLLLKGNWILSLLHAEQIQPYYHLIIIGILLEGLIAIAAEVTVKEKKISEYSFNRGFTLVLYGIFPLVLLPVSHSFSALFLGRLLAYVASLGYFVWKVEGIRSFQRISFAELFSWAKQLKDFPAYYVPLILFTNLSIEMPVFLLYQQFGAEVVGLYSLTYRLAQLPLSLIQNSISEIYFLRTSEAANNPIEMMRLYKSTLLRLTAIGLLPVLVLPFAPYIVGVILGPAWVRAGEYIQLLYPFIFFSFLNSSISSALTVLRKLYLGLILTIVFFFIRLACMLLFRQSDTSMLLAFSLSSAAFYIVYNFVVYICIRRAIHEKTPPQGT